MIVMAGILLASNGILTWNIWNIGIMSFAVFFSYCILTKIIYNAEKKGKKTKSEAPKYEKASLREAYLYYGLSAGLIIVSGIWLSFIGKEIALLAGLKESFIGNLLIGFATTLPEITVSVAAFLIGAKDIAIANMIGSNLFNTTIVFIDDILYRKGPILESVSSAHLWSGCVVIAMTAVIIIAMIVKTRRKFLRLSWYVPILFAIFLLGAYINFVKGF
jgi:cation:H+ antiporter